MTRPFRFRVADTHYAHPGSVEEVRALVDQARSEGRKVRVWGAAHSVDDAIGDASAVQPVLLDRLRDVVISPAADGQSARVEVGAGCHLGHFLYDPTHGASWEASLTEQLERAGFALDSLGGISHQTVAGFLSTGSAGGSLVHDVGDNVVGLELVDGRGRIHRVRRDASDPAERDLFDAAGVSMGLLGVITRVTLQAVPSYDVIGREITLPLSSAPIDLEDGDGRASLVDLFHRHDYARVLWWPQPGFDRLQVWTGDRVVRGAASELEPFEILGRFDNLLGALLQTAVGNVDALDDLGPRLECLDWFAHLERVVSRVGQSEILHRPDDGRPRLRGLSDAHAARLARLVRSLVFALSARSATKRAGELLARHVARFVGPLTSLFVVDGEKHFRDRWHLALPMDNQLDDHLWPTAFAELWVPLESAPDVFLALGDVVAAGGDRAEQYRRVRAFPIELYPGPASRFWLSPGYGRPGLRVNPCRFTQWPGEPNSDQFARFVDAVAPFSPRPHWGKHLPQPTGAWRRNLHRELPRLGDFLRLRRELDPDGVFLTDYWRAHLGIEERPAPAHTVRGPE